MSEVIPPCRPQPSAKFYPFYFWTIEEPKGRQEYNLSREYLSFIIGYKESKGVATLKLIKTEK
jgi:hypothetical protein